MSFYDNLKIIKDGNPKESELIQNLLKLNSEQLDILEGIKIEMDNKTSKKSIIEKIENFIGTQVVPIGHSLTAATLFDLLSRMQ